MSLISAEQTYQLATVLVGLTAFGFWVETTQIGRKLSGVLIILIVAVVLSSGHSDAVVSSRPETGHGRNWPNV